MTAFQSSRSSSSGYRLSINQLSAGRAVALPDLRLLVGVLIWLLFAASPSLAAGFAVTDQDPQATAMGGARAARVGDPSAIYYNPGGLAFAKANVLVGATASVLSESLYQGQGPGIGVGAVAEQETGVDLPAHAYLSRPLSQRLVAGLGIYSPYWMSTEWSDPDNFAGRYLATESDLRTYDLHPTLAYRLSDGLGIGAGLIYRVSDLSVSRRLPGENPFTGQVQDIANWQAESDFEGAFGWSLGIQQRLRSISWGASYRSEIEVQYAGVGRLTQISTGNDQLDELNAASLPFGQELGIASSITFPEVLTVGLAASLGKAVLEVDVSRTGWSSFDRLVIDSPSAPELTRTYMEFFEDTMTYRLGFQYGRPNGSSLFGGFAIDESPQPDSTVGPLFVDADRTVLSVGYSRDWLRVALQWIEFAERQVTSNVDDFNGNYRNTAWSLGVSVFQ